MELDDSTNKPSNNYWPVIIWWLFILVGLILKLTKTTSSFLLVVGFAGLSTLMVDYVILHKSKSIFFLISFLVCLAFFVVLLIGAFFNGGYPINLKGVVIFSLVAVPGISWRIYRFRRKLP